MTQKEFIISFMEFLRDEVYKPNYNRSDAIDKFIEQHHKEYFEVEHIRKDDDVVCNSQTEWENGGLR